MNQQGFTLIELLIVVAMLAALSAIALPVYNGYIQNSRQGALINNIATIEVFQEDFRLRTGSYAVGLADIAAIDAAIGWRPQSDDGATYAIAAANGGASYDVTARDAAGTEICRRFPEKVPC
jgi:prepilin-type N-terminal cleavage/methylation domain-containing protein